MATSFTIDEYKFQGWDDCEPRIGRMVKPEGWSWHSELKGSDWTRAEFYLELNSFGPIREVAVNITVSGRTVQRIEGCDAVRVRIEFVGDGESSQYCSGWMFLDR